MQVQPDRNQTLSCFRDVFDKHTAHSFTVFTMEFLQSAILNF